MRILSGLVLLTILHSLMADAGERSVRLMVRNPSDINRKSETVAVPMKEIAENGVQVEGHKVRVTDEKTGATLLHQVDEDGLLFQSDFNPQEIREFLIQQTDDSIANSPSLVDGGFERPREDYAWENDRIAFRMYGPALAAEVNNGIDVWTKRVRYLIVDKWYRESAAAGKDTYHEDHGEGADLFSVGRTLGAGGCGLWLDGKVLQPGVFSSYRTLCSGPLRVAFELTYANWNVGGRILTERMRISLDAGQNLNRIQVFLEGVGPSDSVQFVCGLVKRNNTIARRDEDGRWVGLWGPTTNDTTSGYLGTGIVVSPSQFSRFTEDKDQYLAIGKAKSGEPFVYYAGAGWTLSGDFSTENDWISYLRNCAQRNLSPLIVTIHRNE